MTRYYVYFPCRNAVRYSVVMATGLLTAQMDRFCLAVSGVGGQYAARITQSEAKAHLAGSRRATLAARSDVPLGAAAMEDAVGFLASHPFPAGAGAQ